MKSNTHNPELNKFQNYLKAKKENCSKEASLTLEDFKSDNLTGQIYNKEDVEELLDKFFKEVSNTYSQEIDRLINSAGSYVGTALTEAERNGFEINVDVDLLDNKEAVESLKAATKQIAKRGGDVNYKGNVDDLLVELDTLKTKNKKLQEELIRLTKDKGEKHIETSSKEESSNITELKQRLSETEHTIAELTTEMNKKLNESVQFNNLKKMMQQRNDQIKKLRERLGKYENVEDIKMD